MRRGRLRVRPLGLAHALSALWQGPPPAVPVLASVFVCASVFGSGSRGRIRLRRRVRRWIRPRSAPGPPRPGPGHYRTNGSCPGPGGSAARGPTSRGPG
ncbi:hypothetical protein SLNWT_6331 [Streptomyces albus]|uniref:Uncharacterized protein n=1 Tax=Streptomyces albus (strain ATCC 21838 / DSM 41398 / FERM P-419 / JCM 4703 / NBRC 107858) TaxID=1081613 RepID=A0A0B5F8A9_STRA4|nr:hypothetical protein SLNWT_6331 [Streptomyces albus]AOU81012.1 hypothetical protein SLNHY_6321 [Streptomyces albus]AYN36714.1 hypothetical protein DUI70_6220 [Streptomyces albus]